MRILVVEDDALVRKGLEAALRGHEVFVLESLTLFSPTTAGGGELDLVLLDLKSDFDPDASRTLAAIPALRARHPRAEIWVQSGSEELSLMRACIRAGAHRFVLKEHLMGELPLVLAGLEERNRKREGVARTIRGSSPSTLRLREEILWLSSSDADILIEGESGSGKELCASALAEPLVAVNVAALPAELFEAELFGFEKGAFSGAHAAKQGLFEAADGGALFLDEIQSLAPDLQAKLLRVVETRRFRRLGSTRERIFSGRILCAANVPLSEKVATGEFREDLYHRIASVVLRVPPLRLRAGDIEELARGFLADFDPRGTRRFDAEALQLMRSYDWPGNVRELKGLVRSLVARVPYPVLGAAELREHLAAWEKAPLRDELPRATGEFVVDWNLGLDANLKRLEEWMLRKTLQGNSTKQAQEQLGLRRSRFYEKLRHYDLLKETEDR